LLEKITDTFSNIMRYAECCWKFYSWDPITILGASWSRHFFGRKFLGRFVNFSRVFHLSNQLALSGYGLWS